MRTSAKERAEVIASLIKLGISYQDAETLRRIAKTLHNWFKLECRTADLPVRQAGLPVRQAGNRACPPIGRRVTRSIERDENEGGRPYLRVQYMCNRRLGRDEWIDRRFPIADREVGARRRLAAVMSSYKGRLVPYVQSGCRKPSLYVLRKTDLRGQNIESVHNLGVAVC